MTENDRIICPICNKNIENSNLSITHREKQKPAHFDCVIKEISGEEDLAENEEVYYLGKGSFGILNFRSYSSNHTRFIIRKRIQYEYKEKL
jgi:hypothetical protein